MSWRDLSIGKKLGVGFGFVLLLLVIISWNSWSGIKQLIMEVEHAVYYNSLSELILQKEVDHMNWRATVVDFLLDESQEELKVQTDDHKCQLGIWLYGDGRKEAEQRIPAIKPIVKNLEKSHLDLHEAAKEIMRIHGQYKDEWMVFHENSLVVFKGRILPALKLVKIDLRAIIDEVKKIADEENQHLISSSAFKSRLIVILSTVALVLGIVFSLFIGRFISGTLEKAVVFANRLADGDLTTTLELQQKDELGKLVSALNFMAGKISQIISSMNNEVMSLSSSSNELSVISQEMSEGVSDVADSASSVAAATEEMSSNMNSVAAASEQASTNVNIVATASEEISASIAEVSSKTKEARSITGDAVELAGSSSQKVDALGRAAGEISKVTQVITEISDQTNLLALNATIEAARAGDAGKGFAVVANEIKELARQTAAATREIRASIELMQSSTDETVNEIRQITDVIQKVDEIVAAIALSVEEQSVTTSEITNNVLQAAQGIGEVNENVAQSSLVASEVARDISSVSQLADNLSNSGAAVEKSAADLAEIAEVLKKMVSQFKLKGTTSARISSTSSTPAPVRELMRWNASLNLNIKQIDEQHKQLVEMINDLHRAMKQKEGHDAAGRILGRLIDYTEKHFAIEEQLFQKYQYPEYKSHKAAHEKLVAKVVDFQKKFKSGQVALSMDIMDFLKDWLVTHIKGTDKQYAPFLKSKGMK